MAALKFLIFTVLYGSLVKGEAMYEIIMHKMDVDLKPNPYVSRFIAEILPPNDTLTIETTFTQQIPDDFEFKNVILFNDAPVPAMNKGLCECFDDKMFAPDVLNRGIPEDKFPKQCPIMPYDKYIINEYKFDVEKLPPGIPEGYIISDIYLFRRDDEDNIVLHIHSESTLNNKVPVSNPLAG